MTLRSIMFRDPDPDAASTVDDTAPAYFADLNLDQVVSAVVAGRERYALEPYFYTPLPTAADVEFRHAVFQDLERSAELHEAAGEFAVRMRAVRDGLERAEQTRDRHERNGWFLEAARGYVDAVQRLDRRLAQVVMLSEGLRDLRDELSDLAFATEFTELEASAGAVADALTGVRYTVHIKGSHVRVSAYEDSDDYEQEVTAALARLSPDDDGEPSTRRTRIGTMNPVEETILGLVAELEPAVFAELQSFCDRHRQFVQPQVDLLEREIQFYLSYLDFVARTAPVGGGYTYPQVSDDTVMVRARDTYDLSLAILSSGSGSPIVTNDIVAEGPERIVVVTGPNQGGKTTLARTFGQLFHLTAIGVPVPGRSLTIGLCDTIATHFAREESGADAHGRLEEELVRLHEILETATSRTVMVLNESLASTSLRDARLLGAAIMRRMIALDLRAVYVTFVDELTQAGPTVVSMVAEADADDPRIRTFKVVRRPADGVAHAEVLAKLHGLDYPALRSRIGRRAERSAASSRRTE
ncbi:MutS-related protein [Tsukamurella soli]|uniref:DNA mismatch repair protein MutS n=1 Tax=Tsukamurella soli TaxID=644556 RepID=A0ABP8JLW5_9ACTN